MGPSTEADLWRLAGIGPGARAADVGRGPGALLPALAAAGPSDHMTGVDGDPAAVEAARADTAGESIVEARCGRAYDTELAPGSFDAVMVWHVRAHNGGRELAIVGPRPLRGGARAS